MERIDYIRNYVELYGKIYFMSCQRQELFSIDIEKKRINCECIFDWERDKGHADIFLYENKIVVIGMNTFQICIFDPEDHSFNMYSINFEHISTCVFAYLFNEKLWMFPEDSVDDIVIFDIHEGTFEVVRELFKSLNKQIKFKYGNICDNKVYLNDITGKNTVVVDIDSKKAWNYKFPFEDEIFAMTIIDNIMYITSASDSYLYVLDMQSRVYNRFYLSNNTVIAKPLKCRDGVILFTENEMFFFNKSGIKKIQIPDAIKGHKAWFFCSKDYDEYSLLFPFTSKYFVTIDFIKHEVKDYFENVCPYECLFNYEKIFIEKNDGLVLNDFLKGIKSC